MNNNKNLFHELRKNGLSELYIYNNFNDLGTSMITLIELTFVNNWNLIVFLTIIIKIFKNIIHKARSHAIMENSHLPRFFFVIFYLIIVLLFMNTIIAFTIDYMTLHFKENHFMSDKSINETEEIDEEGIPENIEDLKENTKNPIEIEIVYHNKPYILKDYLSKDRNSIIDNIKINN